MSEETTFIPKLKAKTESILLGISIRAWIALIITFTGCSLALAAIYDRGLAIPSDFMIVWTSVLSYYFGKTNENKTATTVSTPVK